MVDEIRNGVSATLLDGVAWRKSSFSGAVGNCVEIAPLSDDRVAVRNSRHPNGPALVYTWTELTALVAGVKR